jgi:hypothetical protein
MSIIKLGWDDYTPYEYQLPKIPKDSEIIGYDIRNKKDQKWVRTKMPDFKSMTAREQMIFISREQERCDNGVWFMLDGEPTYITGMNYEHLVYNRFQTFGDGGYAKYYDSQREDFYFRDLLHKSENVLGGVWVKGRRYGLTSEEVTNHLYVATHNENMFCYMLSMNEKKAKKTLFKPVVYALRNRPAFMKPQYFAGTGTEPQNILEFTHKKLNESEYELNSVIQPVPNSIQALDAFLVHYATADEFIKWPSDCDPYVFHGVTKETLKVGMNKRGICNYTSTIGDDDDVNEVSIKAGHTLWQESNAYQVDENRMTKSGLWKWFIPAWKAFEGKTTMDEFGRPYKDATIDYIMSQRKKHEEGSPEWLALVRKYPIYEDEGWNTVQTAKVFDTIRLNTQLGNIRGKSAEELGIIKGNIEQDLETKKCFFVPTQNGKWEFAGNPNIKSTNRFTIGRNGFELPDDREYAVGFDPIRYNLTTSGHLSKSAIVALQKQSFDWKNGTDIVIPDFKIKCIYLNRTETKEDSYADAIKTGLFLSAKICAERQVSNFIEDYAIPNGAIKMLTLSPYDNQLGVWTTKKSTEDGVGYIQTLMLRRPRLNSDIVELQVDHLINCGFEKLIEQLKSFDPLHTTKFDLVMALIMAFFEYIQMSTIRTPEFNKAMNDAMGALYAKR